MAANQPSSANAVSGDQVVYERLYGPLLHVADESYIRLALDVAAKEPLNLQVTGGQVVDSLQGPYHIVKVVQLDDGTKLVVRVPAVGWGQGISFAAGEALKSEVDTMQLVREQTIAPVPQVYAWDRTTANAINAPYICMSFTAGRSLSSVWFENSNAQDLRLRILDNLARIMASFSSMSFPKLGSICKDAASGEITIGPVYDWTENHDQSFSVRATGPFSSIQEYLDFQHISRARESVHAKAAEQVLPVIKSFSPLMDANANFVLCPPNLDARNIMADNQGNITGFLDWSLARTMPRHVGWARHPGWLVSDWDPSTYRWPGDQVTTDSPQALAKYRQHYNNSLGRIMQFGGDWHVNNKSHIAMAIWIASIHPASRLAICCKFLEAAFRKEPGTNGISVLWEIGEGWFDNSDWRSLSKKLKVVIA